MPGNSDLNDDDNAKYGLSEQTIAQGLALEG
jgi:hypothetical protein